MLYLYFWQNGNHRYDDAENKVEADEELVFGAVVGFGVVEIKQYDCCKGQGIMQDSEEQQTCGHRKQSHVSFSEKSGFGHTCLQTYCDEQGVFQCICSLRTWEPTLAIAFLSIPHPHLIPGVGKVDQEDELDQDEHEGAHNTKVEPNCD